ncbi:MAG: DUF1549 domain-containing protein [Pirellulaceae bacterium]
MSLLSSEGPTIVTWLRLLLGVCIALLGMVSTRPAKAQDPDAAEVSEALSETQVEFFEKEIRPLLVSHCLECHASDTEASGGLVLDSREGWRLGGDSGAAIVPESPDEGSLLRAVAYEDPRLQMPPDGKLSDDEISAVRRWIEMGAPDPRSSSVPLGSRESTALPLERSQEHWAYRPIEPAADPARIGIGSTSRIDSFLDFSMAEYGVTPAPRVSRGALLRRLMFDLHGLAPTIHELTEFEQDGRPDAVARQVDRLLASPRFGERYGRHWLDVARFGESLTLRGLVLPNAWRYRDFVVESFDLDLSYDQFVRQQIAGDLYAADARATETDAADSGAADVPQGLDEVTWRQHQVAATAYLALGNNNLEDQDKQQLEMDIIDEQLDVIGKGLLGQTISCSRCHDHKFDPIPTADYYALAGILKGIRTVKHANVSEWIDVDLPMSDEQRSLLAAITSEVATGKERLKQFDLDIAALKARMNGELPATLANVPLPVDVLPGVVLDDSQATAVGDWTFSQYSKRYIGEGYRHDANESQGMKTLTFAPEALPPGRYEIRFAFNHGDSRASAVPVTVFSADGEREVIVNQRVEPPIDGRWVSLGEYRFEPNGQCYLLISNTNTNGFVIVDAIQFLPLDADSANISPASEEAEAEAAAENAAAAA